MTPEEERPVSRAMLVSLQLVALALCALVVMNMLIESALHAPREVCIVEPSITGPAQ